MTTELPDHMDNPNDLAPLALVSSEGLGPLPEPHASVDIWGHDCPQFTREQMRAYALQERAAERERCAKVAENEDVAPTDDPLGVQQCIADSIRRA